MENLIDMQKVRGELGRKLTSKYLKIKNEVIVSFEVRCCGFRFTYADFSQMQQELIRYLAVVCKFKTGWRGPVFDAFLLPDELILEAFRSIAFWNLNRPDAEEADRELAKAILSMEAGKPGQLFERLSRLISGQMLERACMDLLEPEEDELDGPL